MSRILSPNQIQSYGSFLQKCINRNALDEGKRFFSHIMSNGFKADLSLNNLMLDLYVKCGCMTQAHDFFNGLMERDTCTWECMLEGCNEHGLWKELMTLFRDMESESLTPNQHICIMFLGACAQVSSLRSGMAMHACVIKHGHIMDMSLMTSLISMYAKCGSMDDALFIFFQIPCHKIAMWNMMLVGCTLHGNPHEAIQLFWKMQDDRNHVTPNEAICVSALKACAKGRVLREGKEIHDCVIRNKLESLSVGNTLINMYSKCGRVKDARRVFDNITQPDIVTWSAMIAGYGEHKCADESFKLFLAMETKCVYMNEVTFLNILKSCISREYLDKARVIHGHITKRALTLGGGFLENTLIDVYAKCGNLIDACHVFKLLSTRNVVSWSALIAGHTHHGFQTDALALFHMMMRVENGISPNSTTFVSALKACADSRSLEIGQKIHFQVCENGLDLELLVGSAIVDMYSKCGNVKDGRYVFNTMPKRNIVSWSSLIAGYVEHGAPDEAIQLFWQMESDSVKPDEVIFVAILKACLKWGMLEQGKRIHRYAVKMGYKSSFFLGSTLVDMYTRCGSLDDACHVFNEMTCLDTALCNTMIIAYGQYGFSANAFHSFHQMQQDGINLNHITFVGVLSACTHSGLLNEGIHLFKFMELYHCTCIVSEHYVCLVDLLGRAGLLEEAMELVQKMPCQPNVTSWASLLGTCKINDNLVLATSAIAGLLELDPYNTGALVLLSNIL